MAGLEITKCMDVLTKYPQYHDLILQTFRQTIYFKTEEIIRNIQEILDEWEYNRIKSNHIYVCLLGNDNSKKWIYKKISTILPHHTVIKNGNIPEISKKHEILIIDDWVLSGISLREEIDKLNEIYKGKTLNITSISVVFTEMSEKCIDAYNIMCYYTRLLRPVKLQGNKQLIKQFFEEFTKTGEFVFPVHSEYKIPNGFGSFYEQCRTIPYKKYI
jgi:pyrimidine operon attenuation protein/uracil phosphoribosyltransferase